MAIKIIKEVNKKNPIYFRRCDRCGCEFEFEKSDMGKRVISKGKALIGHNRKATVGSVNNATAHPFVVGDSFAMVHNGTLRNHKALADTVVDSEALAIHLSKVLVEDFDKLKFEEEIGKKSLVSRILNGTRSLTLDHMKALARRFNIPPSSFMDA